MMLQYNSMHDCKKLVKLLKNRHRVSSPDYLLNSKGFFVGTLLTPFELPFCNAGKWFLGNTFLARHR
jgi:hypothetical protein